MTHVLIVDDERSIHKSYRADILSAPERYTLVDTIVSAADALMVCGAKHIDLILMDINTAKNESGIEASRRIKKSFPTIKGYSFPDSFWDGSYLKKDKFKLAGFEDAVVTAVTKTSVSFRLPQLGTTAGESLQITLNG